MPIEETLTLKVDTKVKKALIDALQKIGTEGKKGASAVNQIDKNMKKLNPGPLNRLASAANRANGGLLEMVKSTTLMGYNLQGIVLVAVNKLRTSFVDMTDQFNRVIGQMTLLSGSSEEAARLTYKLQEAAVATGWSLDNMSSGMTKLHVGIKQYGVDADRAIELTKNFGLWMRAMGDEGKRVPKVLGNLVTMFQRSTLTLEKLETLLGRGRAEQFLARIGENYTKIAKIDLSDPINKGLSAMQIFDREMKKGTINFQQFFEIFQKTIDEGALFGTTATEIGHGWNQVQEAVKTFITRLDEAIGGSNKMAGILSGLSQIILGVAKHIDIVVGAMAGLALLVVIKNLGLVITGLYGVLKVLKLITLAMLRNPISALAVIFVGVVVTFRKEIDELAKALVKWVDGLKNSLGWVHGFVAAIAKGISAVTGVIADVGKVETPKKADKKGGGTTPTGTTTTTTGAAAVRTAAPLAQLPQAYTQHLGLQDQMRNLEASRAAGRETPETYQKGLAKINQRYKELLRSQAEDLRTKPFLTKELQNQVKATQHAADAQKKTNEMLSLDSVKSLDRFDEQIKNMNVALANNDLTATEYKQKVVELNRSVKQLKVTHADEINTYKEIKERVDQLNQSSGQYVKNLKEENKQKANVANLQGIVNQAGMQLGQAAIDTTGKAIGGSQGELFATMATGALAGSAGGPVGTAVGGITAGIMYVAAKAVEVKAGKSTIAGHEIGSAERGVRDIFHEFYKQGESIRREFDKGAIDQAERDRRLAELNTQIDKFRERRADDIAAAVGRRREKGGLFGIGGKGPIPDLTKQIDNLQKNLGPAVARNEKAVNTQQKQVDKMAEMQMTLRRQEELQRQQLDAQKMLVEESKRQLAVMQKERDAALLEARLQSQANRDTITTGSVRFGGNQGNGRRQQVNVNLNFQGDIGSAVKTEIQSDNTQQAMLHTVYENSTEVGEFTGGRVA